ncbi:MAG: transglutaminase domain-containing protein, partial [Clostridiales bacterium]|nr:transglutaminase domain-containing protein [Clostridiales bacterium]
MKIPQSIQEWSTKKLQNKAKYLPKNHFLPYQRVISTLSLSEKPFYLFLMASLPLSDYGREESAEILEHYLRHGLMLRAKSPFAKALPIEMFLEYVLQPRVNNERLEPCREVLYEKIKNRVKEKNCERAAIEVNYWCCEQASYEGTDARTATALTVIKGAKGRCGEETVLLVHALRSVGIAARQIYTPLWAHTNDNHAWVEVYCDGRWQYMGACEPDERLNTGWFRKSAARGMLIHSRSFGPSIQTEEKIGYEGAVCKNNQLARYGKTKRLTVRVFSNKGAVQGARVDFQVVNDSKMLPLASVITNEQGKAVLQCAKGSLLVTATLHGQEAFSFVHPQETSALLQLQEQTDTQEWETFTFLAPQGRESTEEVLTFEERIFLKNKVAAAHGKRKEKIANFYQEEKRERLLALVKEREQAEKMLTKSLGNVEEIIAFLKEECVIQGYNQEELLQIKIRLLETLREKDWYDVSCSLLLDHFLRGVVHEKKYPKDVFDEGILCPYIALEEITPWRKTLELWLEKRAKEEKDASPGMLWQALTKEIRAVPQEENPLLTTAPTVLIQTGVGSKESVKLLFIALCRTRGIPAKLRKMDQAPLVWQQGGYEVVSSAYEQSALVHLLGGETLWKEGENWSLSHFTENGLQALCLEDVVWDGRNKLH